VLISDGENSRSVALTGTLASQGIRIFAVGIGTEEGGEVPLYTPEGRFLRNLTAGTTPVVSTLDSGGLEALADATGGRYWTYTGQEGVPYEVSAEILKLPPTEVLGERWILDDQRRWTWLAIALATLLLEMCLPERRRMPTPVVGG
jgi:Ca-activated chloride channel family protein